MIGPDLMAVANCQMLLWYDFNVRGGAALLGYMAVQMALDYQSAGFSAGNAPLYETIRDYRKRHDNQND